MARLFGQFDSPHTSLYYKFFFHGLLSVPFIFKLSSVEHLIAIRVIFACIGIANLFLFYGISNKIYKDKNIALILTALLVSCLYFFSQWSRIRADFIVLFICLLGIYLNLTWSNQKLRIATLAIAPLIMILTTPKAIYWIFILTIFCWPGGLYFAVPLVGISLVFILSALIFNSNIFLKAYSSAANYFISSWIAAMANTDVMIYELRLFFETHFIQVCLACAGIDIFFSKKKFSEKKMAFSFFAAIFFVIFHPQKYPSFIGSLLPFLILPAGLFVLRFRDSRYRKFWYAIPIAMVIQSLWMTSTKQWWRFNEIQLNKVSELEINALQNSGAIKSRINIAGIGSAKA